MENPLPSSFTTVISRNGYDDEEHDEIDNDVVDDAMPLVDVGADVQPARYCIEDRRCTEQSIRNAANIVVPSLQQRAQFDCVQQIHVANESQNNSVHAAAMVDDIARFNGERLHHQQQQRNSNDDLSIAAANQNHIWPNGPTTDDRAVTVAELTSGQTHTTSANGRRVVFTLSEHQLQELIQCGEANVTPIAQNSASV